MNDANKAVKKKLRALIEKWEALLDLDWWTIRHSFIDGTNDEDGATLADTSAMWHYREAKIRWFLPTFIGIDDYLVEACVVHELVHVLANSMESRLKDDSDEQREFAVECLARSILKVEREADVRPRS